MSSWLLIKVDRIEDIGVNELERILVKGEPQRSKPVMLGKFTFKLTGVEVHPATKE